MSTDSTGNGQGSSQLTAAEPGLAVPKDTSDDGNTWTGIIIAAVLIVVIIIALVLVYVKSQNRGLSNIDVVNDSADV